MAKDALLLALVLVVSSITLAVVFEPWLSQFDSMTIQFVSPIQ